jgi:hypothetical protein
MKTILSPECNELSAVVNSSIGVATRNAAAMKKDTDEFGNKEFPA